ncbi:hypothetical protein GCM10027414_11670 [Humibacter ginsengiterrae]
MTTGKIDRQKLVRRHNPRFTSAHPADVLTVGNGDLAATLDCTGLQTFAAFHELLPDPTRVPPTEENAGLPPQPERPFRKDDYQIPLRTQSTWGWYETPGRRRHDPADATTSYWNGRRMVPYLDRMGLQRPEDGVVPERAAAAWLHYNPRRLHLGRLVLAGWDGFEPPRSPGDLESAELELDLFSGAVVAEYHLNAVPVRVHTTIHPEADVIATRIESELLAEGLAVQWCFEGQKDELAAFETAPATSTRWQVGHDHAFAIRQVGTTTYSAGVRSSGELSVGPGGDSVVAHTTAGVLEVVVSLQSGSSTASASGSPSVHEVFAAAKRWWAGFWNDGAAVSFAGSSSAAAPELERRVVVSQYLTTVNCAGSTPPQETGLTLNSWSGKFHLEMHWWHAAHFALWGRGALLERSLEWYRSILPVASEQAKLQGYLGARWPKQTDPSGAESPSQIGVFIIWHQPHIIHLLELLRIRGVPQGFVEKYLPLVQATAEFMADFVQPGPNGYELPPPLVPAQESYFHDRARMANPTFELAYWAWALKVANRWRMLAGKAPDEAWERIADGMRSPQLMPDGTYAGVSTPPYLIREDHPSMLMAYGWLPPTPLLDREVMRRTLQSVEECWDFQSTWGWDYPVMSMTASRLGRLDNALRLLLLDTPKNHYLVNGHNPQRLGFLPIYLPSNGGLLAAIAHLVAAHRAGAELPEGWVMRAEGF